MQPVLIVISDVKSALISLIVKVILLIQLTQIIITIHPIVPRINMKINKAFVKTVMLIVQPAIMVTNA